MKRLYSILAAAILFGTAIPTAKAAIEVSVDFFHDHLDAYGDWREVGDYGYVWQPRDVDRDWRPYSDGRWLYTDAGWTWDSDEPYSWAVYHYGRWARVDRIGWVWVPGTEWGPAWVSWRRSERHVGWAPLPPEARFQRTVGLSFGVDVDFDIGPANYRFVQVRDFGEPRLRRHFVEPRENITIINQTTNITRITYVNNVVYNEGPRYDAISRESAQPIRRLKLERREDFDRDPRTARGEQFRTRVEGDSFRVMAPTFDAKPATAPRKFVAKVEKPEVDRGWKNAGPAAAVAKLRTKIKSEPPPPAAPPVQPTKNAITDPPAPAPVTVKDGDKPPKPTVPEKPEVAPIAPAKPIVPTKPEVAPVVPEKPVTPEKPKKPGKPETLPVVPDKPVVPDRPAKPGKPETDPAVPEKPVTPDEPKKPGKPLRPSPPVKEETAPPNKPGNSPRKPADAPPKVKVPERKTEDAEPKRKVPPVEKIQPDKNEDRPKTKPPVARKGGRDAEPRPNANKPVPPKPVVPAVAPDQPAKEKDKRKKKDGEKTEEAPK